MTKPKMNVSTSSMEVAVLKNLQILKPKTYSIARLIVKQNAKLLKISLLNCLAVKIHHIYIQQKMYALTGRVGN
jgi:hypothetical protein